jgi:hypothetical protein
VKTPIAERALGKLRRRHVDFFSQIAIVGPNGFDVRTAKPV